jgi:hypothetical protein
MIESTIQIKAVFDMRKVLKPDWRAWYTPNGEFCENPRKLSKLMTMGMLPGMPDLIVVSPEGKPHFFGIQIRKQLSQRRARGLSIMGDPRVTPPFRCALRQRSHEGFSSLGLHFRIGCGQCAAIIRPGVPGLLDKR